MTILCVTAGYLFQRLTQSSPVSIVTRYHFCASNPIAFYPSASIMHRSFSTVEAFSGGIFSHPCYIISVGFSQCGTPVLAVSAIIPTCHYRALFAASLGSVQQLPFSPCCLPILLDSPSEPLPLRLLRQTTTDNDILFPI